MITSARTPVQSLLAFVVAQKFESLEEYPLLETPLREQYSIVNRKTNRPDVVGLINTIVNWENDPTYDSLEETLLKSFRIEIR